jgi:hypothetical protein
MLIARRLRLLEELGTVALQMAARRNGCDTPQRICPDAETPQRYENVNEINDS